MTWRGVAGLAVLLVAVVVPSSAASAHAELAESTPASGERLVESPPEIALRFTESVELLEDAVRLLDADGAAIEIGEPRADGAAVTATVPSLPDGAYVVDWKVVSADGHPVSGAFTFTVGDAAPLDPADVGVADGAGESEESTALILWRALTYAGFAAVLGSWAFVIACWRQGRRDRGILLLVTGGAAVALGAAVMRAITESSVLDTSLAETFELRSGRGWLALIVLAVLALGVPLLLRSRLGDRWLGGLWFAAAAAVGVSIAFAGHGASGRAPLTGTVLTVVHVAAASAWIGGLAALVRCLVATDRHTAARVALRFSNVALGSVAVLATAGGIQAVRQLESVDALTDSDFGRALLIKLSVIAVVLAGAVVSRRVVHRSAEPAATRLRTSVGVELAFAAAVFGLTGWLAGASPIAAAEATGPVTVTAADTTGSATASATITPAAAGPNSIHLTIDSTAGTDPDEVALELAPTDGSVAPIDVTAFVGPGHVMSDLVDIPFSGQWTLTVNARYGDFDLLTFELPFDVS
jgi:copper transport protein